MWTALTFLSSRTRAHALFRPTTLVSGPISSSTLFPLPRVTFREPPRTSSFPFATMVDSTLPFVPRLVRSLARTSRGASLALHQKTGSRRLGLEELGGAVRLPH